MGEKNDCCLNLANEVEALENCTGHRRGYILWLPIGGTSLWTSHSEWEMALHSHRRTACIVESPLLLCRGQTEGRDGVLATAGTAQIRC